MRRRRTPPDRILDPQLLTIPLPSSFFSQEGSTDIVNPFETEHIQMRMNMRNNKIGNSGSVAGRDLATCAGRRRFTGRRLPSGPVSEMLVAVAFPLAVLVVTFALPRSARAQQWTFHGTVDPGCQSDAMVGPDGLIHFVAQRYRQFDFDGNEVLREPHGDAVQFSLGFPPAIAVGDDGSVHLLTRQAGSLDGGYDIQYERRDASGVWDINYLVGSRGMRNYIVSLGWASPGEVYATYTEVAVGVWTDLHLFSLEPSGDTFLGTFTDISRVDTNTRMRTSGGRVFLASGKCDPGGKVYTLTAGAGPTIFGDMVASQSEHSAGTGRRGSPDVATDGLGRFHLLYGAAGQLYYNRYGSQGQKQISTDILVLDALDDVYDTLAVGAIAASEDGQLVLVVGLRMTHSPQTYDADLVSSLSTDGGNTFGPPMDLGRRSNSGEGRQAPRLVALGSKFFLFFLNDATGSISLGSFTVDLDGDGFEATADCDDSDPAVYPGAQELCFNGLDDDCDGDVDEGCTAEDASVPEVDSGICDAGILADAAGGGADAAGGGADAAGGGVDADTETHSPGVVTGGCRCASGVGDVPWGGAWLWLMVLLVWLRICPSRPARGRHRSRGAEGVRG